jgi:FixJ family two-component response regulator
VNSTRRLILDLGCLAAAACLILDVRMPGRDGGELQRLLANANHRIPIIFVTAYTSDDERRRAKQAGAVAFLHKPVSEQALISAIQGASRLRRQDENGQMDEPPRLLSQPCPKESSRKIYVTDWKRQRSLAHPLKRPRRAIDANLQSHLHHYLCYTLSGLLSSGLS